MIKVSGLYVYPVKSLGGTFQNSVSLTDRGFENDRRWMLIDEKNRFISQREFPEMSLLTARAEAGYLNILSKNNSIDPLHIIIGDNPTDNIKVEIWDDICDAQPVNDKADKWFSDHLGTRCRLVYMPENSKRLIGDKYSINNDLNSFSDDFPVTIISEASLEKLNDRLEEKISMNRFRPNIVIEGTYPFQEDDLKKFNINGIEFTVAKPLARCPIPSINQETGKKGKEPLKTLSSFRMRNNKIYFGQNLLYNKTGIINVGDPVQINN